MVFSVCLERLHVTRRNDFGQLCHHMAMRHRLALLAAVLLVMVSFRLATKLVPQGKSGDFKMLWAGARLVGPDLYDWKMATEACLPEKPRYRIVGFVRLPPMAIALWPLAGLPLPVAFRVFQVLSLCALLAFVWLWSPRPRSLVVAALFIPIWIAIGIGQESCILLLLAGVGVRLIQRDRPFAGGAVLALCAFKPHLFLFLPVVLVAQWRWRALSGMLASGTAMYILSSIVVGLDWPAKFLASVALNRQTFRLFGPGLSYLFTAYESPAWVIVATEAAVALVVYAATRRLPWITAAVYVMAFGVILAPWSFIYDLTLVLPLALSALSGEISRHKRAAAPEAWSPLTYCTGSTEIPTTQPRPRPI
jgi:hypothetical protein